MPWSYKILMFLLILLMLPTSAPSNKICAEIKQVFNIVIDVAHGPAINVTLLKSGLENITKLIEDKYNVTINVWLFEHGRINKTVLSGVDLWFIPPLNGTIMYKTFETDSLKWFMDQDRVLILASSAYISFNPHPDPLILNDILNSLNLGTKVRFYHYEGTGDTLYDNFHGLVNGCVINITKEYMSKDLQVLLNKSLIVRSASIEVLVPEDFLVINAPYTAYSLNGNLSVSYGNFSIFAMNKTKEHGTIVLMGFAEVLTNATSPLGVPWLKLGDNLVFFENLLTDLLRIKEYSGVPSTKFVLPLYLAYFGLGVILLVVSIIERKPKLKTQKMPRKRRK